MKAVAALICICACSAQSLSQFIVKGSIDKVGNHPYIFLYRITGIHKDLLIDSITILPGKEFHFVIQNGMDNGLYKLAIAGEPNLAEFPEKAFFFIADSSGQLELRAVSAEELYKSEIVQTGQVNNFISTQLLKRLAEYFSLVSQFNVAISPEAKGHFFKRLWLFQEEWLGEIQATIISSRHAGILIAALYFLAKIQHASGYGDFSRYFNLVKMYLGSTDLTKSLFEYSVQTMATTD
ncbi:MAG: hypothetical protein EOO13_02480 [Chitinophagaceae bacterium]|nr:MAG: hypothetical protein EOO13_02480 [Chitinophagaceae bacterium]